LKVAEFVELTLSVDTCGPKLLRKAPFFFAHEIGSPHQPHVIVTIIHCIAFTPSPN